MRTHELKLEDNETVDRILNEGIQCCAQIEVGEAVDCLMTMFQHIQETEMVKHIKQIIEPDKHKDIDQLLICFFVSEVATLTANFRKREEKGADA